MDRIWISNNRRWSSDSPRGHMEALKLSGLLTLPSYIKESEETEQKPLVQIMSGLSWRRCKHEIRGDLLHLHALFSLLLWSLEALRKKEFNRSYNTCARWSTAHFTLKNRLCQRHMFYKSVCETYSHQSSNCSQQGEIHFNVFAPAQNTGVLMESQHE